MKQANLNIMERMKGWVSYEFLVLVSKKQANKTWDGSSYWFMINIKFK
jgi:hypothetical protein